MSIVSNHGLFNSLKTPLAGAKQFVIYRDDVEIARFPIPDFSEVEEGYCDVRVGD